MKTKLENYSRVVVLGLLTLSLAACDDAREEQKVAIDQVPPAVKATIEQESKGGTLKEIEKLRQEGKTAYGANIVMNGKEQQSLIAEDGTVIKRGPKEEEHDDND
jgi:hypothetical protein